MASKKKQKKKPPKRRPVCDRPSLASHPCSPRSCRGSAVAFASRLGRGRARFAALGPFPPAWGPSRAMAYAASAVHPCRSLSTGTPLFALPGPWAGGPRCSARPWLLGGNPPRREAAPVVVPLRGRLFYHNGPRTGDPPQCSRLPPHARLKVGPAALAALRSAALRLARLDFAHYVNRSSPTFRCHLGASAGPQFPRGVPRCHFVGESFKTSNPTHHPGRKNAAVHVAIRQRSSCQGCALTRRFARVVSVLSLSKLLSL